MADISEWNPGERMPKEFALKAVDEISSFYRRLYYFPEKKPFNNDIDFEGAMQVLNGLKELIELEVKE